MTESQRITKLFEELYNGTPWIDVNISATMQELTWRQAASRVMPGMNSAWEIINHLISWRDTVLQRLKGKEVESPDDNYFTPLNNFSPTAWEETQQRFAKSLEQWVKYVKKVKATDLKKTYGESNFTHYDIIMGILEHDAYHLGQIRLLRRLIQR